MATSFTLQNAQFLISEQGRDALSKASKMSLHPQAGALLTLARLRQRAVAKFPLAQQLFYTPEALEQATAWPVALHHAAWFEAHAPDGPILDLGCGIGGDTLALAQHRPVIAYERDPVRLCFAQANADVLGLGRRVEFRQADWTADLSKGAFASIGAAFVDPARRVNGKRVFSLYEMEPPLADLLQLQQQVPALGVKVMPSVKSHEIPVECSVEFVSHAGVCKEALLWFDLPTSGHPQRWASIHTTSGWHTLGMTDENVPTGPIQQLDAHLFDAQIAYLVSLNLCTSPVVQTFQIEEVHPFKLKLLNRRLKALGIGQVELKKRGFPIEPETLRPQLKLTSGGRGAVVIFTRQGQRRLMLISRRV